VLDRVGKVFFLNWCNGNRIKVINEVADENKINTQRVISQFSVSQFGQKLATCNSSNYLREKFKTQDYEKTIWGFQPFRDT